MPRVKIGVELASLRLPFRKGLVAAARLGADGVVVDAQGEITPQLSQSGLREVKKLLEQQQLRVGALSFRTSGGYGDVEGLEQRVEATRAVMQLAYRLGTTVVIGQLGRIGPADSDAYRLLVDVLADLGRFGHRAGAMLAVETGNDDAATLARLLDTLPEQSLNVDLNPGKLLAAGLSPSEFVATLGRWVAHVHATDAVRDLSRLRGELVSLGRGAVDFPEIFGRLEEAGYGGHVTVEAVSTHAPADEMASAIAYLRRL